MNHSTQPPQQVQVEQLVPGGDGLAHLSDGRVVFVPGGFVGDHVELLSWQEHGGYCRATEWKLSTPSSERRAPPCPVADRCGGCDWMGLQPEAQLRYKRQLVEDALRRVGKFESHPDVQIEPSPSAVGYRNRVRLQIASNGRLGFLRQGSHELVAIGRCLVCSDRVNRAIEGLQRSIDAADRVAIAEAFEQVEVRCLAPKDELLLVPRRQRASATLPASVSAWLTRLRKSFVVDTAGRKRLDPQLAQRTPFTVDGESCELTLAPGVFTQVNWRVNERIASELVQGAVKRGVKTFADLYCGVGNFSLPLLRRQLIGTGVESHPVASACARASDETKKPERFQSEDVARTVRRWALKGRRFDLVIVDPPRAGVGKAIDTVAELSRRWIFYCACDPVSFARDARRLTELGFELEQVRGHDMFPQTHHVELAAWFVRRATEAGD